MSNYTKPKEAIKTETVTIRFTRSQKEQLKEKAYSMGISISQLITNLLPL